MRKVENVLCCNLEDPLSAITHFDDEKKKKKKNGILLAARMDLVKQQPGCLLHD